MHHLSIPLIFLLCLTLAGCSKSTSSYVPKASAAKDALTLALDAWKNGQSADPAGKLPSGATVRAIDSQWTAGAKLTAYEIVQEFPAETQAAPRKFAVKLTFADGSPPVEAAYFVVGIDPLQVCREQDYEKTFGMAQ